MARPKLLLEDIQLDGWKLLESLIIWTTAEYCAEQLNVSVDTLDRRIKEEHGVGFADYKSKRMEKLRMNLRKKQYDVAMAGNPTLLIWLGKNELGQSDKNEIKTESAPVKLIIEGLDD